MTSSENFLVRSITERYKSLMVDVWSAFFLQCSQEETVIEKEKRSNGKIAKSKRKCALALALVVLPLFATGCDTKKTVTLSAVQHSLRYHIEGKGYYFKNDQLSVTEFIFDKGYYLEQSEIDALYWELKYPYPSTMPDNTGYIVFTAFTKQFDEETGYSWDFFEPQTLTEDMTIHYGIWA